MPRDRSRCCERRNILAARQTHLTVEAKQLALDLGPSGSKLIKGLQLQ
jgi:hypothetical protein